MRSRGWHYKIVNSFGLVIYDSAVHRFKRFASESDAKNCGGIKMEAIKKRLRVGIGLEPFTVQTYEA